MFSFKSLAVFSTLAFGALSALAVPVLDHNNVDANAVVVARCDCDSVPNIIADVTVAIAPYIYTLRK
ncbi:hypothetical protein PHLCEN_2v1759 [Hermanssonia centrifuga]|uniref:Uncharacterized protein n=1 Tax=Hermanssonia centrifuga TaxID=98765 RepID=A0A2R6RVX9_9APHY|nr:hypothetical protein PHLCEN_2v1759 [Hermanssonia centrifuga]